MPENDITDLLYGVEAIARYLNMTTAQVYHLHGDRKMPTFKMGKKVCARKASLITWLEAMEKGPRDDE